MAMSLIKSYVSFLITHSVGIETRPGVIIKEHLIKGDHMWTVEGPPVAAEIKPEDDTKNDLICYLLEQQEGFTLQNVRVTVFDETQYFPYDDCPELFLRRTSGSKKSNGPWRMRVTANNRDYPD